MIYERVAYFLPKFYKEKMKRMLGYAGFEKKDSEKLIGFFVMFSFAIGLTAFLFLTLFGLGLAAILIGLIITACSIGLIYLMLTFMADSRAKEIETVLPDALQLMAANIRAGMTVENAIWLSARPEFGILEEEIRKMGVKTLGGKSIKTALRELSARIRSSMLERTVKLLIEGINSGGELAHLLEETATNIRISQALKKDIRSSVMMYSLFIFFAAVIGTPLLFSISLYFVEVTEKMMGPEVSEVNLGGFAKLGSSSITPEELFWFAISTLLITTFLGSMIMGLIQYGEAKRGLKYAPILVTLSISIFLASKAVMSYLFSIFFSL